MNEAFTLVSEQTQQVLGSYEAVTVAIAMNVLGAIIKKSPIDNRWIPLILLLLGTVAYAGWMGWTFEHVIIGIVVGASPVGFHQFATQTFQSTASTQNENKP